jgi:hypothetical protein
MFFPLIPADKFKQGDIALIQEITGMDWLKWLKLLNQHGLAHDLTKLGFFAVALQRARGAAKEEVVDFVNDLPLIDGVVLEVPADKKAKKGDEDPTPPPSDDATES